MTRSKKTHPATEIRQWPGLVLCSALQVVLTVDEIPGAGEEFEQLGKRIDPTLADGISLFLLADMPGVLADLSLEQAATDLPPEAFLDWVEEMDAQVLASRSSDYAQREDHHRSLRGHKAYAENHPTEWTLAQADEGAFERIRQLRRDPLSLKAVVLKTLRSFWDDHFKAAYARHADALRESVDLFRRDPDLTNLPVLIDHILGRSIPEAVAWQSDHMKVLLVPFPFMGPYLMSMAMEEPDPLLILAFDAPRALALQASRIQGPDIAKLKALADETRLRILRFVGPSERFGGDIVTHLGITQPGVSRHLRLLAASGLLTVRQEGTSKYYSLCDDGLEEISDQIRRMQSGSNDDRKDGGK